ncbi:sigma-54 interaction domain-containing protein [Pseudobacillus badius]|uniref:sigma-54 interaction domain-containing protein n=1 Tax=Bacillus badius TaxID=1455 RepID=UPI0007B0A597|nr:sigma 54-interacting transcriptional regulator [Bacillus badius]KZO00473.1 sigma-54-dependent Fis family transcriptional regulator [Bacillus badius]MED0667753.1 sigma 54-interacting transcriptional regulator [Bacillus badius]OCS86871.1 sigma-54-dependent Fis family transcriptional regulator [Bacillus badius]OVE47951.1 sigma-54-dependent Fis family transcriptional regulator [Bacillus badius]TDV99806.1 arginine utilization regulatory protein [Bacillus badius]
MNAKTLESLLIMYEEILEKIDLGIHVIDSNERTVIYNKKMREIEGMGIEDVLDKNLMDVFDFGAAEESTLLQVLKSRESIQNVKQTYFNNKGQEITTINHTFPITENGTVIGAMEIAKDVTKLEKMIHENMSKKDEIRYTFDQILGQSPLLKEAIETGKRAARTASSVLIIGEIGTGKELFARSIHHDSPRSEQAFFSQNCAALPDTLMETLLFGIEEQPDAEGRPGLFEQADGGTILFDEIDSLSPALQTKLLKVIQEKKVRREGGNTDIFVDVRILATISEDPIDAIAAGNLRKDLYYRLSAVSIFIPPLRERKDDIELLTSAFIDKYNHLFGMDVLSVDEEVKNYFQQYEWPGNIRELEHVIEGAMNLMDHEETISFDHLPIQFRNKSVNCGLSNDLEKAEGFLYQSDKAILPLDDYIQEAETYYITKALQHHDFNITKTAKALGMSRQNLQYRIRKYNIGKV